MCASWKMRWSARWSWDPRIRLCSMTCRRLCWSRNSRQLTSEGKYHAGVKQFKKQLIVDAVVQTRGNYVEAATLLGVHANYLHRLIKNLGLKDAINKALREPPRNSG